MLSAASGPANRLEQRAIAGSALHGKAGIPGQDVAASGGEIAEIHGSDFGAGAV